MEKDNHFDLLSLIYTLNSAKHLQESIVKDLRYILDPRKVTTKNENSSK
jgi:hypothetical protein